MLLSDLLKYLRIDNSTFSKVKGERFGYCCLCSAKGKRKLERVVVALSTPSPSLQGDWPDRHLCALCAVQSARVMPAIAQVITEETAIAQLDFEQPDGYLNPVQRLDTREVFRSVSAAAKSVGVTPTTLRQAIQKGWQSGGAKWRYYGKPKPKTRRSRSPIPVKRVDTGEVYPSVSAASKATGLAKCQILTAIRRDGTAGGIEWRHLTEQEAA
jgi:hypothetical protein